MSTTGTDSFSPGNGSYGAASASLTTDSLVAVPIHMYATMTPFSATSSVSTATTNNNTDLYVRIALSPNATYSVIGYTMDPNGPDSCDVYYGPEGDPSSIRFDGHGAEKHYQPSGNYAMGSISKIPAFQVANPQPANPNSTTDVWDFHVVLANWVSPTVSTGIRITEIATASTP